MLLRFVEGRPVSGVTCRFLSWVLAELAAEGKRALLMVWDNAYSRAGTTGLAPQQGGAFLYQSAQSPSQAGRRVSLVGVSAAFAESLAQQHRTQVGARQARCGRTGQKTACG